MVEQTACEMTGAAKEMYDRGDSLSAVGFALYNARRQFEEESSEERKVAKKEITDWKIYENAMERAKEIWGREGTFEAVDNALTAAKVIYEKLIKEERAAKEAEKKKAVKPTFEEVGAKIGRLVSEKNTAYGDSFARSGDILKILYPNGIGLEQYEDMLALIRIIDKLFRIATSKDSFKEDPYTDIAGYCILKVAALDNEKRK